jgi:predicted HTH transcriptional regulator
MGYRDSWYQGNVFMLEREDKYLKREELKELLEDAAESKDVDYKSAVKFEEGTDFASKLVKHVLAFANSGGGYLVIGYKEQTDRSLAPDLAITDEIVASYEVTRLCQYVEKYLNGQDRIKIRIYKEDFAGIKFPIIRVFGFQQYPFVCTKDCASTVNRGAILESGEVYIRTEGARTLTVKAPSEWRQLIRETIKAWKEAGIL